MPEISDLLRHGSLPAAELTARLGVSPPTLMRRANAAGNAIVRIGATRATRYGLRQDIRSIGTSEVPLFRVSADGRPAPVGRLVFLAGDESAWLPGGVVFDGLPPEIADMCPSGFMGRTFATRFPELPVPPRVDDWSDEHVIVVLARRGEDLPGNLIVGDESLERWYAREPVNTSRDDFPAMAEAATLGDIRGSSAGGERPKFSAFVDGKHVLVKFVGHGGPVAERWRDLLLMEKIALDVLRDGGHPASTSQIIDTPSHLFLEVDRFDRVGMRGRLPAMTLSAVHPRAMDTWAQAAHRLSDAHMMSRKDTMCLQLFEAFGRLIANTDRHNYNIVLFPKIIGEGEATTIESKSYSLAPAFDQLPMHYAPTSDGQVRERDFTMPAPTADTWDVWNDAKELAISFWDRCSGNQLITDAMRKTANRNSLVIAGSESP